MNDAETHDTMEGRAVVDALLRQLDEVTDVIGCQIRTQIDDERSNRRRDHGLLAGHLGVCQRRRERRRGLG